MADTLLTYLRASLPTEVARLAETHLKHLEDGEYERLLRSDEARTLLQDDDTELSWIRGGDFKSWNDFILHRLEAFCGDRTRPEKHVILFCIGYAALLAFIQANVTGPPLGFQPSTIVLPKSDSSDNDGRREVRQQMLSSLTVDGIAPYKLTPHIELLCLADAVMTCPAVLKNVKAARWGKMRVAFLQQRLLAEVSSTLQNVIYDDIDLLVEDFKTHCGDRASLEAEFLLERATIHTHHSLDKFARADLDQAKKDRKFEFALTGLLGKRTKFQQKETSQLLVLAKSYTDSESATNGVEDSTKPANLDLNDDTLLESISFSEKPSEVSITEVKNYEELPPSLRGLDPSVQPRLQPLDSVILLSLASSIQNTSPEDGLTREETLPYATRVIEGGSSNWQVYTQALLVRSRIEGYRSRTVERGLLQLQTLVDQSASVTERVRYIFQLATPTRWELEAELASRWVQLGGLRSALEIYERLEMWAEAALCHAATEREDNAKRIVRRQLFYATKGGPDVLDSNISDKEEWTGPAREPPPLDAPRLYCILGDIDQSTEMYEKAWEVSSQRYARAQRSIGRHFIQAGNMVRAAEAYSRSLKVNQLNQQSWFALGCALLELTQFSKAVEAFSRCVQLDETDAESWSNLAAALLRTDPKDEAHPIESAKLDDEDETPTSTSTVAERARDIRIEALKALTRAASLKHDSYRIWENVLIVAASIQPEPDWTSVLSAQRRIIDLRGPTDGEKCVDIEILTRLVNHIIATSDTYDPSQPGMTRMVVKFVDEHVVSLITSSAELWHIVGKLALWRNKPSMALDAEEKAWRAVTSQPGWESDSEAKWDNVVDATIRLVEAYESLGQRERTEGMSAGSGELVAKDWMFKARTAVRGIMGKGKDSWEDGAGWQKLRESMEGLRG
ncbi:hypothetical protein DOTSEDRAFT_166974 [Dothistroma septosporum NZE10]|uniref:Uncharacterized protein n=1 Tax=Dothistroma septosporum (strain NZE10 / CBS 128990) TaxID=675120 RepID=N1PW30_DOTSN|nr:hypothetical protein DOTSEDRAFT_166974 [Dothistroma septosporum NZE10]